MNLTELEINTLSASDIESYFSWENFRRIRNIVLDWGFGLVGKIIIAILIWVIGKKIIKWVVKMVHKALDHNNIDVGVVKFIASLTRAVLYVILFMIMIQALGFQTTSLIAVLGSAALAIGMSLQGSLSNFAGGILLIIFKPFKVGDYIVTGTSEGTVVAIDLLYTKLHTVDNKTVMLPNGALSNSNITNVAAEENRRLDIQLGISYDANVKQAKELLRDILENEPNILQEKEIKVFVKNLDQSAVTLETRVWVKTEDYWDTRFHLLEEYKQTMDDNHIAIPYNQMDVHIITKSNDEP